MKNLLRANPSEAELEVILDETRGRSPLPSMNSTAWREAARKGRVAEWMHAIRPLAESDAFQPMPRLTDELYAVFGNTGERRPFEQIYHDRRRMLARSAMMVLLGSDEERRRFAPDLVVKIREIMQEPSWAAPAHVTDPSGKDALRLDLFAAESANLMAEMLTVFAEIIPTDLAAEIKARLRRDVFENYLERTPAHEWVRAGMNWNAVCHQGVLGSALAVEDDSKLLARMLMVAREGLPRFLDGYGEDGATSEGPSYWQYGFGWFAELNAQLECRTGGRLSLFEDDDKVRRIAHFGPQMTFDGGYFINFSDGDRKGILRPGLLAYLGGRLASPELQAAAARSYHALATEGFDANGRRADFMFLSRLVLQCPDTDTPDVKSEMRDVYFPDYEVVVARGLDKLGNAWEFAAKAGNNHEHHNHNDCGSFILHLNGAPVFVEIGAPEYVGDYFTDKRYTFLAARSLGHSVPIVNGFEQSAGTAHDAKVIAYEMTPDRVTFVMDLAKCYPIEARCRRLIRSLVLDRVEGRLTVMDMAHFEGAGTLESVIISDAVPVVDRWGVRFGTTAGGVRLVAAEGTVVSETQMLEYRNRVGQAIRVNRVHARPVRHGDSASVEFSVEPVR